MYFHYKKGKKEKRTTILHLVVESPSEPPGAKPLGWVRKAAPPSAPPGTPLAQENCGGLPPPKACLESCKYMMFGEKLFCREHPPPPLNFSEARKLLE